MQTARSCYSGGSRLGLERQTCQMRVMFHAGSPRTGKEGLCALNAGYIGPRKKRYEHRLDTQPVLVGGSTALPS